MAVSEFQRTLLHILSQKGINVANLAEHTGYNPLLLENLIAGKSRKIPVDFFIRVADALDLTTEEKDALVRSWAFGSRSGAGTYLAPDSQPRESSVSDSEEEDEGDVVGHHRTRSGGAGGSLTGLAAPLALNCYSHQSINAWNRVQEPAPKRAVVAASGASQNYSLSLKGEWLDYRREAWCPWVE